MLDILNLKRKKEKKVMDLVIKREKRLIQSEGEAAAKKIKKKKKLTSKDYELCRQIRKARIKI